MPCRQRHSWGQMGPQDGGDDLQVVTAVFKKNLPTRRILIHLNFKMP